MIWMERLLELRRLKRRWSRAGRAAYVTAHDEARALAMDCGTCACAEAAAAIGLDYGDRTVASPLLDRLQVAPGWLVVLGQFPTEIITERYDEAERLLLRAHEIALEVKRAGP